MSFTDYLFVPAFLLLSLIYFLLPAKVRWVVLLCGSLLFYASWGPAGFAYLLTAVAGAWAAALWLEHRHAKADAYLAGGAASGADGSRSFENISDSAGTTDMTGRRPAGDTQTAESPVPLTKEARAAFQKREKRICRAVLWAGVVLLVGILVLVKLRGLLPSGGLFTLIMPLGISYYTLSLVGYMADVYWRKESAERNPLRLLLFAVYFPKILEGPISKHRLTARQLNEGHDFDYNRFCYGLQRMLWGFFKKLVIAERLGLFVDTVFANYADYHGSTLLVAAVFAAFDLYCDFSGCMDIALGMSEALGIAIEENFNRPFFSRTVPEFWRRWHMSLGVWFKDYIYMPIVVSPWLISLSGKARKFFEGRSAAPAAASSDVSTPGGSASDGSSDGGMSAGKLGEEAGKKVMGKAGPEQKERERRARQRGRRAGRLVLTVVPTAAVWLLTGVWHGTGWNYVVWGIYWGVLMILSAALEPEIKRLTAFLRIDPKSGGFRCFRILRTFAAFVAGRILSMPSSLSASAAIFRQILTGFGVWELFDGTLLEQGLEWPNFVLALLVIALLLKVESGQEKGIIWRDKIAALPVVPRWCIYLGGIFAVLIFGIYGAGYDAASFVYMGY